MVKNKTVQTSQPVLEYLQSLAEHRRVDCAELVNIMSAASGYPATMWGPSIVGFGKYAYKYASGHQGEAALVGFSSRTTAITLYLQCQVSANNTLVQQLGKYKAGKGCIYIKHLSDIEVRVLQQMIATTIKDLDRLYTIL